MYLEDRVCYKYIVCNSSLNRMSMRLLCSEEFRNILNNEFLAFGFNWKFIFSSVDPNWYFDA